MIKLFVKIIISLILLLILLNKIRLDDFLQNLLTLNPIVIAVALCFLIIQSLFVSSRWKIIITKIARPLPFSVIIKMHYMSLGSSLFLPNIFAEPALKSFLMQKYNVSVKKALLSVVLDKLFVITGLAVMTLTVMPIIFALYKIDKILQFIYVSG